MSNMNDVFRDPTCFARLKSCAIRENRFVVLGSSQIILSTLHVSDRTEAASLRLLGSTRSASAHTLISRQAVIRGKWGVG